MFNVASVLAVQVPPLPRTKVALSPTANRSPLGRPTMARSELAVELVSLDHRPPERLRIVPPAPTA